MSKTTAVHSAMPSPTTATEAATTQATTVLRVDGLRKAFGGQVVLDGVNLELHRGEVALLRGDNGSGKTTLLNILTGNLEPDAGAIYIAVNGQQEVFSFPKAWWLRLNPADHFVPEIVAREGVGRTWQETRLFSTQSLRSNVAVAAPGQIGESPSGALLRPRAVRRQDKQLVSEADSVLADLGLSGRGGSSAGMVSLGQAKRVAIARAVRAGARILFLDEPLAGLDAVGIASVMGLLGDLARRQGLTLVIVEHLFNIPRVLDLADTVWTIKAGQLTSDNPAAVRGDVEHHVGEGLRTWMQQVAGPDGVFHEEPLPGGAMLSRLVPQGVPVGEALLEVENLVVQRGQRPIIGEAGPDGQMHGVSFTLRRGELTVLQAPNGWGKTTLLDALAGLIPARGTIRLLGQNIARYPAWERRRRGLTLMQSRENTFSGLKVSEALRLAAVNTVPDGLPRLLDRRIADLSGGEKQRVAAACALHHGAFEVALLDEPFLALDLQALQAAWGTLGGYVDRHALFIAVPGSPESAS